MPDLAVAKFQANKNSLKSQRLDLDKTLILPLLLPLSVVVDYSKLIARLVTSGVSVTRCITNKN